MAAVNDENSYNAPNITTRGRGGKAAASKSKVPDAAEEVPVKVDAKSLTKVDADADTQHQSVADVTSVRVLLRVRPMSASDMRLGYHSEFVSCTDTRCAERPAMLKKLSEPSRLPGFAVLVQKYRGCLENYC
eukprot:1099737-Prorocentrum_minimum.AAC.2